ncbi:MAG: hypothetical protein KDC01_00445 [Flavobacteriales bacterium]|jgi:N-acetylglucosamine kinase-like BadF-type ATPase|nr:hypothetical protein [Flavobacteriales bacterium]
MALLIGDIGGSSSRWALLDGKATSPLPRTLPGFNPVTGDPLALQEALRGTVAVPDEGSLEVIAYGAGCGTKVRAERLRAALAEVWPKARIEVESDLLGAARGLYGHDDGLVLVLGTGMNVGHYDGEFLHAPMPSLGYILGDEGSGADIGKHLLRDALYGLVPGHLQTALFSKGMDLGAVLESTYRMPGPQRYVASFTAPLAEHVHDTYVHDLVVSRFFALTRLLARFFSARELQQVRASGSVAFGFRELLRDALAQRGMHLTAVERDPLQGLMQYHAPNATGQGNPRPPGFSGA